jgi:hypothetical protein
MKKNATSGFSEQIKSTLGSYVYLYIDPTNNEIFYVGKGKNNRAFSHLNDESETEKVERIKQIRSQDSEPEIEILVHGLDDTTARRVESAVIDLIGKEKLTNSVAGWKSGIYGRMTLKQVTQLLGNREVAAITEPAILISVKRSFRYGMSEIELYDATRSSWHVGENTRNVNIIKYAFSVYDYVIQEVYEIMGWYKSASTISTRDIQHVSHLYEFVGRIAEKEIRDKYIFKKIESL